MEATIEIQKVNKKENSITKKKASKISAIQEDNRRQ